MAVIPTAETIPWPRPIGSNLSVLWSCISVFAAFPSARFTQVLSLTEGSFRLVSLRSRNSDLGFKPHYLFFQFLQITHPCLLPYFLMSSCFYCCNLALEGCNLFLQNAYFNISGSCTLLFCLEAFSLGAARAGKSVSSSDVLQ